jgi:uncharacterized phiE125 gp8 family phage protein
MSHVIDMIDSVVTEPVCPPLTVEFAKRHIKALTLDDDRLIESWIRAAADYFEAQTGRQLITATRVLTLPAFPTANHLRGACYGVGASVKIELPRPPLQSVVSVEYIDGNGDLQAFTDGGSPETLLYQVHAPSGTYARRGSVEPLAGTSWPPARYETGSVRLTYTCGYGDTEDSIPGVATAVLAYLVGHFDRFRTAVHEVSSGSLVNLPLGIDAFMQEFKYSALPSTTPRLGPFMGRGY